MKFWQSQQPGDIVGPHRKDNLSQGFKGDGNDLINKEILSSSIEGSVRIESFCPCQKQNRQSLIIFFVTGKTAYV